MPTKFYEVKNFRGYYQGISPARFNGQGMNDEYNPGYSYDSGYVNDVGPTPYGELMALGGVSTIHSIDTEYLTDVNGLYYWKPPQGGDYIFLSAGGKIFRLGRTSTGWQWYGTMALETRDTVPVGDELTFSCFEPYGDALYFCDGVNPPLRISFNDTGHIITKFMGVPVFTGEDFLSIDRKPKAALSSISGASYTYAVTTLSKWGESPATSFRFRHINTAADQDQGEQYGPTGFSPVFIIDWSRIDGSVTHLNIYRDTILGQDLQFVARVARGITSYVDSARDSELGFPIQLDNGKPSNFRIMRAWNDQMFAVGGYGRRNRLSVSRIFYPDVWPPQFEIDTGVIGEGEDITQMWKINGSLYVFCRERTFRVSGFSAEDYSLDLVNSYLGCLAPRSLQPYKNGVVLLTNQGVKFFDGSSYSDLSSPIDAVLRTETPGVVPLSTAAGAVVRDQYWLCANISGISVADDASFPNRTWVCDLQSREWGVKLRGSFYMACPFRKDQAIVLTSETDDESDRYLQLLSADFPYDDHKRTIPRVVFKCLDFDAPNVAKRLKYIDVSYESLKEVIVSCKVDREAFQVEEEESTYTPTFTETEIVYPSNRPTSGAPSYVVPANKAYWGMSWDGTNVNTVAMAPHHVRLNFDKMTGRSFAFYIQFQQVLGPLLIQKIVFAYEFLEPESAEAVFDAPGFGGN